MASNMSDLLNMVQQVEQLPPEVLDLVMHRRNQSKKQGEKASKEQNDSLSQFLDVSQGLAQEQQPPMPQPAPETMDQSTLQQILGTVDQSSLLI